MNNLWAVVDAGLPGDWLMALGFLLGVMVAFVAFGVLEGGRERRR